MADEAAKKAKAQAYYKKWRAANAPRKKATDMAWRVAHPDCRKREYQRQAAKLKEQARQRYIKNRERVKATSHAWRQANSEHAADLTKKWQEQHPQKVAAFKRKWAIAHRERHAEVESRRRAIKRQTEVERVDFAAILRSANGLCGICHKPFDLFGIDFDHIVPLARGGTHTTKNIQATHTRCNRVKGAKVG